MKKGIILNFRRFKLLDYVTQNKVLIIIFLFFVTGIIVGSAVLIKNGSFYNNIKYIFESILQTHINNNFFKKLITCLVKYIIIILLYFLSGTTMLGVALVPFLNAWQGIFVGAIISYCYSIYGLTGIAFNAIILIPPFAVFAVCCFFAAKHSINYSLCIAKLTIPRYNNINLYIAFKNYCYKYLMFVLIALISTIIEVMLNLLFLKYFNF